MGSIVDLNCSDEDRPTHPSALQQELDALKGFAYLQTFRELAQWQEDAVDLLQRANTPLYKRPQRCGNRINGEACMPKVMLVHDYAGGYNDYESVHSTAVDKELYSCQYLQWAETFVYFSHKLVTIPPPTWTNACHRGGVKVLGTFIVEPGSLEVERILDEDQYGTFWVASRLARIAKLYGFDGWLINIETRFPPSSWQFGKLEQFLRQLRSQLGDQGKVVWYDALTSLNFVWYQNGLNHLNLSFALAAGCLLSNYAWTPDLAQRSRQLAEKSGLGIENLYLGIDVWAQNIQRDPKHVRVTWPRLGGGGTGTGLGLRALRHLEGSTVGVGIFGPAWSFEHFPDISQQVDRSMWRGKYLPEAWSCECGPSKPHSAVPYHQNGITAHARNYLSGTDCFFHTDLSQAFSRDEPGGVLHAQLGSQQPFIAECKAHLTPSESPPDWIGFVTTRMEQDTAQCDVKLDIKSPCTTSTPVSACVHLVDLDVHREGKYLTTFNYRRFAFEHCELSLMLKYRSGTFVSVEIPFASSELSVVTAELDLLNERLCGVAINFSCDRPDQLPLGQNALLEIYSLTIQPWPRPSYNCKIRDVEAEHRGPAGARHLRLRWNVDHSQDSSGIPFSEITGPCAFFTISCNNKKLGKSYALEFVVPDQDAQDWMCREEANIGIEAVGFDGVKLGSAESMLSWPVDEQTEWVMVTPVTEAADSV